MTAGNIIDLKVDLELSDLEHCSTPQLETGGTD